MKIAIVTMVCSMMSDILNWINGNLSVSDF